MEHDRRPPALFYTAENAVLKHRTTQGLNPRF